MIAESKIKEGILDGIKKVTLTFEDRYEVSLNQIIEYDFDIFDHSTTSTIDITNALVDNALMNRYSMGYSIINIKIESKIYDICNVKNAYEEVINMPCNMKIGRLRINGSKDYCPAIRFQLVGEVY